MSTVASKGGVGDLRQRKPTHQNNKQPSPTTTSASSSSGKQVLATGSSPPRKAKDVPPSDSKPFLQEEFISWFYKPHTATVLIVAICTITYFAFLRRTFSPEENIKRGLVAMVFIFLTYCFAQLRDGVMRRPHPAFWRLVTGVGIVYLMALIFLLFQSRDDARQMFKFLYPQLGVQLPERSYADACDVYTPHHPESRFKNLKDTVLDEFILAHMVGYIGKALLFRDLKMCWILSLSFEIVEISLQHIMENFKECWWDHVIIDVLICNNIGIMIGLWLCNKFCDYNEYEWVGLDKISTATGKMKRIAQQFTPYYWTSYRWEIFESWKRFLYFVGLLVFMTIVDCNAFFLKFILWIPPRNPLNTLRLILWFFIGMPAIREYYLYITDDDCKRLGANTWVAAGVAATEALIVFKFSTGLFDTVAPPHVWVNWVVFLAVFGFWFVSYFFVFGPQKVRANGTLRWVHNILLTLSMIPMVVMFVTGLPDLKIYQAEFDGAVNNWMIANGYNPSAKWISL